VIKLIWNGATGNIRMAYDMIIASGNGEYGFKVTSFKFPNVSSLLFKASF